MRVVIYFAFLATSYSFVSGALQWRDCATTTNTAITVHSLDISPSPVLFPSNVTASLNLTVNRRIDHIFVDVELVRTGIAGNIPIPCIAGTNLGSCKNIDGCSILTDIINGSTPLSVDFGKDLMSVLTTAVGHTPQCPIIPEEVVFTNQQIHVNQIPSVLSMVTDGDYHMKIMLKDDPTTTENVGCLEIDASIKSASSGGFLFG